MGSTEDTGWGRGDFGLFCPLLVPSYRESRVSCVTPFPCDVSRRAAVFGEKAGRLWFFLSEGLGK